MPKDAEKTCKPREKPGPYAQKPKDTLEKTQTSKDAPKTLAKPVASSHRENLTLADWLTVFNFMDTHPLLSQSQVVDYFGSNKDGALVFQQCTLSQKLAKRKEVEEHIGSHPNTLSAKCVRVVTRPTLNAH
jgi:hypothetical protein